MGDEDVILDKQNWIIKRMKTIEGLKSNLERLAESSKSNLEMMEAIVSEQTKGLPTLADAFGQFYELIDMRAADELINKKHPAISSANKIKTIAAEKRLLVKQLKETRNIIKYYEMLFPWLTEYIGIDVDDLILSINEINSNEVGNEDPVLQYLPAVEYKKLPPVERNQKALDRYWTKRKTPWEIGRDYERYVGYCYIMDGYDVTFHGIEEGFADLGRDLIAINKKNTKIIQCKNWAHHKTIHENHIAQLFGTTLKYWIENNPELEIKTNKMENNFKFSKNNKINGVIVTTTKLSDVAKKFAEQLNIEVKENFEFKRYPCIKCNISKGTGDKIYHLPMDQQYDKVLIEPQTGEFYAETTQEAESKGFRRAYKWKGDN